MAATRLVTREHWRIVAVFFVFAFCLCRACPDYRWWLDAYTRASWEPVLLKAEHPAADVGRGHQAGSHEAKLNFRLTVPIVMRVLGLNITGMLVFRTLCGILSLYLTLLITFRITGSRITALYVCTAVGCVWPGAQAFHMYLGYFYDSEAYCLLWLAIASTTPLWAGVAVFAAAWTDERALLASSLVLFLAAITDSSNSPKRRILRSKSIAVLVGIVAYGLTRQAFAIAFSLQTTFDGTGLSVLARHIGILPIAIWTALGGCWIFFLCAVGILVQRKQFAILSVLLFATSLVIVPGLLVWDLTRSLAYVFPVAFIGLVLLARYETEKTVERVALVAASLCVLIPTYWVKDNVFATWLYPLPVQMVRLFLNLPLHWKT